MAAKCYTIFSRCTQILMQQIGLDEIIDITIQNPVYIAGLEIRPMILDHFIRVQHIGACLLYTSDAADE